MSQQQAFTPHFVLGSNFECCSVVMMHSKCKLLRIKPESSNVSASVSRRWGWPRIGFDHSGAGRHQATLL